MSSIPPQNSAPRKAISRRLRFEILRRDNNTCRYCHATDTPLTIDHVIPVALGGTDEASNLVAACVDCNSGKTSSSPDAALVAQVDEDAMRWSAAMQFAAGMMQDQLREEWDYAAALDDEWSGWTCGYDKRPVPRPSNWRDSANAWRKAGLPADLMVDAARRALGNTKVGPGDTWKYFCGIAWKRITKLQEDAKASLVDPEEGDVSCDGEHSCECEAKAWHSGFDDAFAISLVHPSWIQARALSRVVDGVTTWNTSKREREAA
jgi:hypothetical protein